MVRRVLTVRERFFKDNGLIFIPKKQIDKLEAFDIIIKMIARQGNEFTEKELNILLKDIYSDYAVLRRYLVDYSYLIRNLEGSIYKINEEKV